MFCRQLYGLTLVTVVFHSVLFPQTKITSIEFFGNRYFSQQELIQFLPAGRGSEYSKDRVAASVRAVQEHYRNEGFFFARVDSVLPIYSSDSASVALDFFLDEGKQSLVAHIGISGATVFSPDDMRRRFETVPGGLLHQATLEKDIDDVLTQYENNGYPLARIHVDSLQLDTLDASRLSFVLAVTEGPRVYLDEIKVEGNTTTRRSVIAREAYLRPNEVYDQEKVDDIRRRLMRLGIFSSVSEPQLYLFRDPGYSDTVSGGISLMVQEGNTNNFDGIVGYVPPAATGTSGYFTGNVYISMRNLFGTGRKALVRWQRENQTTQELEASYDEPWVGGYPVNIGAGIFQRKQDSSYIKTTYNVRADVVLTTDLSVAATLSQESVIPSASLTYFTVFESSLLSFGGELHFDTRNDARNPTSGINYATAYSRGTKKITGPEQYLALAPDQSYLVEQFSMDMECFLPLFRSQVLMAGFHGKKITSSQLEQSDLFQIGGTNSVRGYLENQFFGSQILWSNVEYRFLTGRLSNVFGFFDAGYFSRPADQLRSLPSQEKFLYGYGVGTRLDTAVGVMQVSLALGEGDTFSTAKIHFGISNDF
ncbi:MAG TPA: POTRA domain-containing protein [Bacteroidota bacterium]|nr:POTRA domain-containing protein [Bacteroidota bacterium]